MLKFRTDRTILLKRRSIFNRMKKSGLVVISLGLALLLFTLYKAFIQDSSLISPVPEGKGVKVIYVSPQP